MGYYLVFLRTLGKSDGHYKLVKANTLEEARELMEERFGGNMMVDVEQTIE